MPEKTLSSPIIADILGISKSNVPSWAVKNQITPSFTVGEIGHYPLSQLILMKGFEFLVSDQWHRDERTAKPKKEFTSAELFAGAGGLALGLERAGFKHVFLNEIDKSACQTLRHNRPHWNIIEGDVSFQDFSQFQGEVDLLSGGFPCQAFSYAGKKMGFEDVRGTLFFEFARAVRDIQPKVLLAENVKGLRAHDKGRTLKTIMNVISELGYFLVEPEILKAIFYRVPQKRERLILVAVRKDIWKDGCFEFPSKFPQIFTLRDALKAGQLYNSDVSDADGQKYPKRKSQIMKYVPQGGYWRDLPIKLQKEYMLKSFYLGGGKTGMARRLSWDEPSLTLTCAPAQKQTERCHPDETRPLNVREYARIQTFPDDWEFQGSISQIYKQIGNAVPVNLGYAVGRSIVKMLNQVT